MENIEKPWTNGPRELLEHAESHLKSNPNGFDCRIALISIDNAVELSIRTYLKLPKRIRRKPGPKRREIESAFSFPDLLDLLESYGTERVNGIELDKIEWFHSLRNRLYHDGNGLTVPNEQVRAYLQIGKLLYDGLFEESTVELKAKDSDSPSEAVIKNWAAMEKKLRDLAWHSLIKDEVFYRQAPNDVVVKALMNIGLLDDNFLTDLEKLIPQRNQATHGLPGYSGAQVANSVWNLSKRVPDRKRIGELSKDIPQAKERIGQIVQGKYSHPEQTQAYYEHLLKECGLINTKFDS